MAGSAKKILNNQNGVALLLVLGVMAVLIAVSLEANRRIRASVVTTATGRDRHALVQMATSGVHAAMALLSADPQVPPVDCHLDTWADGEIQTELLNALPFDTGRVGMEIIDERSRIQVNALVKSPGGNELNPEQMFLWQRFLEPMGDLLEGTEIESPAAITDAIKDWLDGGDDDAVTGLYGAETLYYQDLEPPYACRNGKIDHIGELLMIRGITPALFYGTSELPGIKNFLTVHGMVAKDGDRLSFDGKVNINTAPLTVLTALLPEIHQDLAPSIFEYRTTLEKEKGDEAMATLASPTWYRNAPGCADLTIPATLITVTSNLFRIRTTAIIDPVQLTVTAVVERVTEKTSGKNTCRVLSWEIS
ncbi:MAG: general secretion pathway protein GspK [Desulfobacterales bacterium]|nr:general secretion pathway protein GspK [Desulfobacterales bacterium]